MRFHVPDFDELHVVSDLHLGGTEPEFQIFRNGERFQECVKRLIRTPLARPRRKWCFVVNGDLVDFLAELPASKPFDAESAAAKLNSILERPEFAGVWDALREVAWTPEATLVIVLGNHDLELALPWIREQLLDALQEPPESKLNDPEFNHEVGRRDARRRIELVFDGTGFRCQVHFAKVLCVHGNEVDPWNYTDYEKLRELVRDLQFGRRYSLDWTPNAGSQLVVSWMNDIKKELAFIDQLKPEVVSIIKPILENVGADRNISKPIKGWLQKKWARVSRARGLLDFDGDEFNEILVEEALEGDLATPSELGRRGLLRNADCVMPPTRISDPVHDLARADRWLQEGVKPMDLVDAAGYDADLGWRRATVARLTGKEPPEVLRAALQGHVSLEPFKLDYQDDIDKHLLRKVGLDVNFLIAGHTHFDRAIKDGRRVYFNSGTWARRIRLTPEMLESEAAFKSVFDALADGSMAALDAASELVVDKPGVVSVWRKQGKTHGALRYAKPDGRLEYAPGESEHSI